MGRRALRSSSVCRTVDGDAAGKKKSGAIGRFCELTHIAGPGEVCVEILGRLVSRLPVDGREVENPIWVYALNLRQDGLSHIATLELDSSWQRKLRAPYVGQDDTVERLACYQPSSPICANITRSAKDYCCFHKVNAKIKNWFMNEIRDNEGGVVGMGVIRLRLVTFAPQGAGCATANRRFASSPK